MLLDYDVNREKRQIQGRLLPMVKKSRLIALAGPNILNYIDMYPPGVKYVQVWENNAHIMLTQLKELTANKPVTRVIDYRYGDIIDAEARKDTFYDLDFCFTIRNAHSYLKKFGSHAFTATFSTRACSVKETIDFMLTSLDDEKVIDIPHPHYNLLKTKKSDYVYTTYFDQGPMISIFKFH